MIKNKCPLCNNDSMKIELANYAHEAWSGWMKYLFEKGTFNDDGSFTINADSVERWLRQSRTIYNELPENEKESDRIEADSMIKIFEVNNV